MAETSRDILNDVRSSSRQAASLGKQAVDSSSGRMHDLSARLEGSYKAAQDKARQAYDSSTDFVKEYPIRTVLGAAAVGFVAGIIARNRRH